MKYLTDVAQDMAELEAYCDILKRDHVRSYLEVGSKFGGSLWKAAISLPKGSRIISIDMPNGTKAWKDSRVSLEACVSELKRRGYDAKVIWGDSKSEALIRIVKSLGPFDAVMIDADHRLPGVTADWENYGPMSRNIVAFHDIGWKRAPEWVGTRIDVPEFWNSVKLNFRYREIKECPTGKNNGIGVLWKINQL